MPADPVVPLVGGARPLDDAALAARYPVPASPWLRVNAVASLDGAAEVDGRTGGLTGPADQHLLDLLRTRCDALLVGAGTLRSEGYGPLRMDPARQRRRRAAGLAAHPTLVVVSGRLALDPALEAFAAAPVRPLVLTAGTAPAAGRAALAAVADVIVAGDRSIDLVAAIRLLHARGLRQILCEGGPMLLGALTEADLVDELCLTLSPQLAGPAAGRITAGPAEPVVRRLSLAHALAAGDFLFLRYLRPHRAVAVDQGEDGEAAPGSAPSSP